LFWFRNLSRPFRRLCRAGLRSVSLPQPNFGRHETGCRNPLRSLPFDELAIRPNRDIWRHAPKLVPV
jgi:hypothetical protein